MDFSFSRLQVIPLSFYLRRLMCLVRVLLRSRILLLQVQLLFFPLTQGHPSSLVLAQILTAASWCWLALVCWSQSGSPRLWTWAVGSGANWLVDTLVTPLFCSNNTGWVFLTLSGGRGWVGSWMGKVCLTAGAGVTWATAGLLVVGTVTAGTTLVMVVGLTWSLRGGSTVGWGIPALVTWDWDVTRVRVTEEAGVVSLTACPVLGSIRSSGC